MKTVIKALMAIALLTGCSERDEHIRPNSHSKADAYVATLPDPDADQRVGMMIGFVRTTNAMLSGGGPVDPYVDAVTLAQTCMMTAYGRIGTERLREALDQIGDDPRSRMRWRRYIVVSSSRPVIMPSEEGCGR